MQTILQDLTFALRQLRRSPGFAITAILTLALGIGANTAIFSLLDQALLRALPVHDPKSLVVLHETGTMWNGSISMNGGDPGDYFSYPMYRDLRDGGKDLTGLIASAPNGVGFTRNNDARFIVDEVVTGNYFDVLGVQPALGRTLHASDDGVPNANPVAVLSYDFWNGKLGADPTIVGSTVSINGNPFQVVGVAAPGFDSAVWGQKTSIFFPISMLNQVEPASGKRLTRRDFKWINILGRLAPGVSPGQVAAANAPLWHALRAQELQQFGSKSKRYDQDFGNAQLQFRPGVRGFNFNRDNLEKPFLAVMAMAVLVLLIASVNVASLLLVRSAGRVREFSLRSALGASSTRIVSQLLIEGVLIGLCGGAVGLLLAPLALRVLISRLADQDGVTAFSAALDTRILLFNFVVAIVVSLLFSLMPALQLRRPNLSSTLRESTGTQSGGLLHLRRAIVCLQIGLSVILLVGAGLFIRTMQKLRAVDVGFNTAHLVTFSIDPARAGYSDAVTPALHKRILEGLAAIPGIQAVAATNDQELANNSSFNNMTVAGFVEQPDSKFSVEDAVITPNYFAAMQMPLIAGRALTASDDLQHPLVTVVNQSFVKHFCNGDAASCLGRQIGKGAGNNVKLDTQIVGVVRDARHAGIRKDVAATRFTPLLQRPEITQLYFYLRTSLAPAQAEAAITRTMHQLDPSLALGTLQTEDQQIDIDLQNERMITLLATAFGVLATLLAGVGLYGVLAYSTTQRTREIGIRMALGSTRLAVSSLIVSDVLRLAAIGLAIALPTAYALSLLLRSQLFGVSAADPLVLLSVVALIAIVALLAAFVPARRAASVNPTAALRTE